MTNKQNLLIVREDLEKANFDFELYINNKFERTESIQNDQIALDFILTMIEDHRLTDKNTEIIYIYKTQKNKIFKYESINDLLSLI